MKVKSLTIPPQYSNISEYYGLRWSEYLLVKEKSANNIKGYLSYNPKIFKDFFKAVGIHNTAISLITKIAQRSYFQFLDENGNEIDLAEYLGIRLFFEKSVKDVILFGYSFGTIHRYYNADATYQTEFNYQGAEVGKKSQNEIYGVSDFHYYSSKFSSAIFNTPISYDDYFSLTLEKKKANRKPVEIEVFDPASFTAVQSIYIGSGDDYYDLPYYAADDLFNALVTLYGVSEFLANNTVTGFFGGGILNIAIPDATPEYCELHSLDMAEANNRLEAEYVAEAKKALIGSRNGGACFISPQRNLQINSQTGTQEWGKEFSFEPFDSNFDPDKLLTTSEIAKKTILSGHLLYKVLNEKGESQLNSNGAETIETAFELLYFTVIEGVIKTVLDGIKRVIEVKHPNCTYTITPTQVLRSKTEFGQLLGISTLNELRENRGLIPIDSPLGDRFLNNDLNTDNNGL